MTTRGGRGGKQTLITEVVHRALRIPKSKGMLGNKQRSTLKWSWTGLYASRANLLTSKPSVTILGHRASGEVIKIK